MEPKIIFLRLVITFILALIFGIERQRSHKPVGFGTFIFVAVGSCSLAIISLSIPTDNPLPLLGAIVTGIGFLGAGALIKTSDKIFGFTTAASIWLFAILGLVIGTGYYEVGAIIYSFVWICIFIDNKFEKGYFKSYQKRIRMEIKGIENEKKALALFDKFKIKEHKMLHKKINKKDKKISISYLVEGKGKNVRELFDSLEKMNFIQELSLE